MTIDEKLEYLTERHKALAESLELFAHSVHEQGENIDKLIGLAEKQTTHIEALYAVAGDLARTAENHERRITRIEERPS